MKILITLLTVLIYNTSIVGQTVKTYTGTFENGKATYQYYENKDYERIFDGTFTHNNNQKDGYFTNLTYHTTSGRYKNNKKTGPWEEKWSSKEPKYPDSYSEGSIKGSYDSSMKIGKWICDSKSVSGAKVVVKNITLNFKKNVLVGAVSSGTYMNGNLSADGIFEGEWNIKNKENEYIAEFYNGIFIKLIVRGSENGEILFRYSIEKDSVQNQNYFTLHEKSLKPVSESLSMYTQALGIAQGGSIQPAFRNSYNIERFQEFVEKVVNVCALFDDEIEYGSIPTIIKRPRIFTTKDK